ncbi:MAG: hypothetical protein IKO35_03765 [Elusimicrobiaceae bacterium]|nr:hypothetical protein [Elusimicrobiaceae bacterium]
MSDVTQNTEQPFVNNDLSVSSVPAGNTATAGQGEADLPADPTLEQTGATPNPLEQESTTPADSWPFMPADWEVFKSLTAEFKLSPEQIQKLLDFETSCAAHKAQTAVEEKHQQAADWANETRALYGANLEQEISFALRAANTFGGPDLRLLLEETGLGNHPVVIRTLSEIGRTISEDACPGGKPSAPQDKTFAEALYGKRN